MQQKYPSLQKKYPNLQEDYPKFNQKLEKFERDLCELGKEFTLPEPQPKEYLFAEVPGYKHPENSFHAAYNLLATLNFVFLASTIWTLPRHAWSVDRELSSALKLLLQRDEIVTDPLTDGIATVCQEFFSDPSNIDDNVKSSLSSSVGLDGDSVAIFEIFGHLFELAKRRYTLTELEAHIATLSKQIDNGVLPEAAALDVLHQTACAALLPSGAEPSISFLEDPQTFSQDCKTHSTHYMDTISQSDAQCIKSKGTLGWVKEKFLQQRERCITAIDSATSQLSSLATKLTELQKSIAEKQTSQAQLPLVALVEETSEQKPIIASSFSREEPPQPTTEDSARTADLDAIIALTLEELPKPTTSPDLDVLPTTVAKPVITTSSDILALKQQLAAIELESLALATLLEGLTGEQLKLKARKSALEPSAKKLAELSEQQSKLTTQLSRLTTLKTAIEQGQLKYEDSNLEVICDLLDIDEPTLSTYVDQQAAKTTSWVAWSWETSRRTFNWAIGNDVGLSVGLSYEEQKKQFVETLEQKINLATTDRTTLDAAIRECQTDKAELAELNHRLNTLTDTIEEQKKTQNELQKQCGDLQTTLQKAKLNSAQQILNVLLLSVVSVAYHENSQKTASNEQEDVLSNTSEPLLPKVDDHSLANTDPISEFVFISDLLEIKRQIRDDAEKEFDRLINTEEKVSLLAIFIAFFTYIKALLDYHTEEIDIKASLKKAKDELKLAFNQPITLPDSLFFKSEPKPPVAPAVTDTDVVAKIHCKQ